MKNKAIASFNRLDRLSADAWLKRPIGIWGARGQIGQYTLVELQRQGRPIIVGDRSAPAVALAQAESFASGIDWVFCSGLTNPKLPAEELHAANVGFIQEMIREAEKLSLDSRYLTVGTVHENFEELCRGNAYLSSKRVLGQWMQEREKEAPGRFLHLRLHTIYAEPFHPHMFLGQMLAALRARTPFEMSTGEQLREYHHAADIAVSIRCLLNTEWAEFSGILELSQGQTVSLAQLAQHIYRALGCEDLLRLGARGASPVENWNRQFTATDPRWFPTAREPLAGVLTSLRRALSKAS